MMLLMMKLESKLSGLDYANQMFIWLKVTGEPNHILR